MDAEKPVGKLKKLVLLVLAIAAIALVYFVGSMLSQPIEPPKKTVQEIKVFRPPPPPPEIEDEPPPEPEVEEEVDIPEPEDLPDMPDMEPAASEQLGLDAEGTAGGDSFGLAARKGGRSLIGAGDGDVNMWYAGNIVKSAVLDLLTEIDGLLITRYRVRLNVWVNARGEVTKFKLLQSTGDKDVDAKINQAVASLKRFKTLPPPNMPQPIKLAIEAK